MPLQDADKPSRRHILAADRKKHGAYDPVRLAKLLPPHSRLQRQSRRAPQPAFQSRLWKRDDVTSSTNADAASQTDNTPGTATGLSALPVSTDKDSERSDAMPPSSLAQINYGDAKPAAPADAGAMHNDTLPSAPVDATADLTAAAASSGSGVSANAAGDHATNRTIGLAVGIVVMVVLVGVLCYVFKRYRHDLGLRLCGKAAMLKERKKSQRLGSMDGLRTISSDGHKHAVPCEDKTGSSDHLVTQVSPGRAGPFDRAISTMLAPAARAPANAKAKDSFQGVSLDAIRTGSYLSVPMPPKVALSHQRSLDSIAEVQEPPSGVSSQFPTSKRDSLATNVDATPKRLTWTDRQLRPMTSPGETGRSFGSSTPSSSAFGTPYSKLSGKKASPVRPQSAKGCADIEMTRQGSKLVIRNRPSTGTLRRPLSSAGSSFRSALRKTRGAVDDDDEDGAICIETDGIVESTSPTHSPREGVYDVSIPCVNVDASRVRSRFSTSSSVLPAQQNRSSYATFTTASPAGSFSFEIKDAVRLGAPVPVEAGEAGKRDRMGAGVSEESFVRDLDWDLRDCTLTSDSQWTPSARVAKQQRLDEKKASQGR
ncbi:conserved hypothetical protein [Sporisorium reilianum SRZ2]|uniref:Uncharacterized protein n=1 Tax=Sporisorium reilianum (strain SRZ2) TaxID=999809 RepID=E6ZXH4_SPORE|nr:conserved hypothetical protein [Sporisorium reilianum SRZ2]